jgi:hypothetical protein
MTIWVDNSILESVAKCSTQDLMRYVFGYTTVGGRVLADAGKTIHASHAVWFTNWDITEAMAEFDVQYELLLGREVAGMEPKDPCQKANLRAVTEQYYLTHGREFFPFDPIVEGIEKVHHTPLVDDIEFFGLIDLPAREKKTSALYAVDHKNRFGYINDWWTKKFSLTSQFSGYIWLLQQIYNETVPGIYINAIQVQKLPDPTTTRCKTHKIAYADCRLQHAKSQLFISSRTPQALAGWHVQAITLAKRHKQLMQAFPSVDMVQYAPDEGRFSGACVFCDFRKWCRADRVPALIDGMFVHDPWEPWKEV